MEKLVDKMFKEKLNNALCERLKTDSKSTGFNVKKWKANEGNLKLTVRDSIINELFSKGDSLTAYLEQSEQSKQTILKKIGLQHKIHELFLKDTYLLTKQTIANIGKYFAKHAQTYMIRKLIESSSSIPAITNSQQLISSYSFIKTSNNAEYFDTISEELLNANESSVNELAKKIIPLIDHIIESDDADDLEFLTNLVNCL